MGKLLLAVCVVLVWCTGPRVQAEDGVGKWQITLASRQLDLTSHQARQTLTLSLTNVGERNLNSFYVAVDSILTGKVAYIGAHLKSGSDEPPLLPVTPVPLKGKKDVEGYQVMLTSSVEPENVVTVVIEMMLISSVVPFPKEISQNEKQLVQFSANAYILSPYPIKTQSTTVVLATTTIESFSRVAPTSTSDNEITYGPYSNMDPYSSARVTIHYENNGPFLTVEALDRLIEISHWGNIAVEEHVHVKHTGATLKGSYSRFDYQRIPNSGISSVKSFKTLLPAAAADVYYRDEIGNISTSNLRVDEDYVELELRPRFPLFGGWQTRYYIGYNLPSYEYLYHSGSHYLLTMRLVDHVMDDQLVRDLTLRIVLPEGAKNIAFQPPYLVDQQPDEIIQTYLDTVGRPVVVVKGRNLVEQHIQDFKLSYDFESWMLLQEPLLVVVALYAFFILIIIVVRLDFSITKDVAVLAKQQASVILEKILGLHDRRSAVLDRYTDTIASFKQSKNSQTFRRTKKSLDDQFKSFSDSIGKCSKDLQGIDADGSAKVTDLQRKSSDLKVIVDESCTLAERLVAERITKQQYLSDEKGNTSRMQRLQQDINSIVKTL
jgi:oligosaccharyltransferase complex subunit alpha (ribophorin I)